MKDISIRTWFIKIIYYDKEIQHITIEDEKTSKQAIIKALVLSRNKRIMHIHIYNQLLDKISMEEKC